MLEYSSGARIDFAVRLLTELKNICLMQDEAEKNIKDVSQDFYSKVLNDSISSAEGLISKYKSNLERINALNLEITAGINAWFQFIKDEEKIKSLTYPAAFFINRRRLSKRIKSINREISDTAIENRFLKQQIAEWEHGLELSALKQLKLGENYTAYEKLCSRKSDILNELIYLLPTFHALLPLELDLSDIDSLIERLRQVNAA